VHLFPVFLRLENQPCVVVGAGPVGLSKTRALLDAAALVTVIEPRPSSSLRTLCESFRSLRLHPRAFATGDTRGALLVFACTGVVEVQAAVAADASRSGALLCRADDAEAGDFTTAAVLRRGPLAVAVSSGGASPALAARARDAAAGAIGQEYGGAAEVLGRLRIELRKMAVTQGRRAATLRWILDQGLLELVRQGSTSRIDALVTDALARAARQPGLDEQASEVDPCTA